MLLTCWSVSAEVRVCTSMRGAFVHTRGGCAIQQRDSGRDLRSGKPAWKLNEYVSFLGEMDGCAVIFVCGPRNVGKSTFIRTLINTLLNQ